MVKEATMAVNKEWKEAHCEIQNRVESAIDGNRFVVYSAWPTENEMPIDNLDCRPFHGNLQFREGKYVSPVMNSPTWLEIAVAANEMIKVTGDKHHVFLEGIEVHVLGGKSVQAAEFSMGS